MAEGSDKPGAEASRPDLQELLSIVKDARLFHTGDSEAFLSVRVASHWENHPVRARSLRLWLNGEFFRARRRAPARQAFDSALDVLEARALYEGPMEKAHVRVARVGDDVYVDLGNPNWDAVRLSSKGVEVVAEPPVKFRRVAGLLALPYPEPNGHLQELRDLVHISDDDNWRLYIAWLSFALFPGGPCPLALIEGIQGCGKTTLSRATQTLVDPRTGAPRAPPGAERDLAIAAKSNWLLCFDNVSRMPAWMSDALCRLSTGSGFQTRRLYTDDEEAAVEAKRPVLITTTHNPVRRHDLLSRLLLIRLSTLSDSDRKDETGFWKLFGARTPRLFGALCDLVSKSLAELPNVQVEALPRLADYVVWGTAVERALGWPVGSFRAAFNRNRTEAVDTALDGDEVGTCLHRLIATKEFRGTATALLEALQDQTSSPSARRNLPQNPRILSQWLHERQAFLEQQGIFLEFYRKPHTRERMIHAWKAREGGPAAATPPAPPPLAPPQQGLDGWMAGAATGGAEAKSSAPPATPPPFANPKGAAPESGTGAEGAAEPGTKPPQGPKQAGA